LAGKEKFSGLLKRFPGLVEKILLVLSIAMVAATVVLTILFQRLSILTLGIGIPGACIAGIVFFLSWTPPAKPSLIALKAEPEEIIADGKSTSTLIIELQDKQGNPMPAPADTEVAVGATKGKLEKQVIRIPKGEQAGKTILLSSQETGPVTLSVDASGLESLSLTLNFIEKPRFCMHCGARMSTKDRSCPKCSNYPPSGVDTKLCKNCNEVIPIVAKFCGQCGASQPV
jgi:ribosomal protein L40E